MTLFAYGETGSGKTHTMSFVTEHFLADLVAKGREYEQFSVRLAMVEIENEKIYDLSAHQRTNLSILNYQVKGAKW